MYRPTEMDIRLERDRMDFEHRILGRYILKGDGGPDYESYWFWDYWKRKLIDDREDSHGE